MLHSVRDHMDYDSGAVMAFQVIGFLQGGHIQSVQVLACVELTEGVW